MEEASEKPEQTPEADQKGHIAMKNRRFNIPLMIATLGISDKKVFYASKRLPKGWNRKDVFSKENTEGTLIIEALSAIKNDKNMPHERIQQLHNTLKTLGAENTHQECLFIRHARKHFIK